MSGDKNPWLGLLIWLAVSLAFSALCGITTPGTTVAMLGGMLIGFGTVFTLSVTHWFDRWLR